MAITVKIEQETKKEISFPCLMRHKSTGAVILFTDYTTGTVIVADTVSPIGEFNRHWNSIDTYSDEWEPSPPITLSNS